MPRVLHRRLGTRAGATSFVAAAVAVMGIGGSFITDHIWMVDQRDVLKRAADAASVAATIEMNRRPASKPSMSGTDRNAAIAPVAKHYVQTVMSRRLN